MEEERAVVERVRGREVLFLRISGRVDDRFDPQSAGTIDAPTAIEMSGVRAISSHGVKRFVEMMKKVSARGPAYLVDCPPCIVDQLNLVQGFSGGAEVLSARSLFSCDCGNEEERIDRRAQRGAAHPRRPAA